jgi:general secretion pathway protein G
VNITDKNAIKFIKGSKIPKDPWGNDYVYKVGSVQGEDYCIISYGADGAEGGEGKNADINSCSPDEE